jgi:hypothetical protein
MRADMFKVVVERPRRGGGDWGARAFRASEDVPAKLGMRSGYSNRKWLNENLAPLRRFLESQAGRSWDSIFSEICRTIDGRSTVKQHIRQHIEDFVVIKTQMVNGEVVGPRWHWGSETAPLAELRQTLYVDPRNGCLLRNTARDLERRRQREAAARRVREAYAGRRVLDAVRQLHKIDGVWFLVEVASLPLPRTTTRMIGGRAQGRLLYEPRWDALRKTLVSRAHGWQPPAAGASCNHDLYGNPGLYAVSKRQLSRRDARRYGV